MTHDPSFAGPSRAHAHDGGGYVDWPAILAGAAAQLRKSLDEQYTADRTLSSMAELRPNRAAAAALNAIPRPVLTWARGC